MKRKWIILLLVVVLLVGAVFAWRLAYFMRKSNDNLPSLTTIAEMSESEANSLLAGYKIIQLREVWGKADFSAENEDRWEIGDVTLIVNYKNNGVVVTCGLKDKNGASVGES